MNFNISQDRVFSILFIITALICFGSILKLGKNWDKHKVFTLGAVLTGLGFLILGCTVPLSLPEKVQQITKSLEFALILSGLITITIPPTFGNSPAASGATGPASGAPPPSGTSQAPAAEAPAAGASSTPASSAPESESTTESETVPESVPESKPESGHQTGSISEARSATDAATTQSTSADSSALEQSCSEEKSPQSE